MSKEINLITKEFIESLTDNCSCPDSAKVPAEVIEELMRKGENNEE